MILRGPLRNTTINVLKYILQNIRIICFLTLLSDIYPIIYLVRTHLFGQYSGTQNSYVVWSHLLATTENKRHVGSFFTP